MKAPKVVIETWAGWGAVLIALAIGRGIYEFVLLPLFGKP